MNAPAADNGNGQGLVQLAAGLLPALSLALALIVAVQPGGTVMFSAAALAPLLVVHYWTISVPSVLPIGVVFAAGLLTDALSQGPLGFWALLYVASYELAARAAPFARIAVWRHMAALVASLLLLTLLQALIVALYTWQAPQFQEASFVALCAALTYPALMVMLSLLAHPLIAAKGLAP